MREHIAQLGQRGLGLGAVPRWLDEPHEQRRFRRDDEADWRAADSFDRMQDLDKIQVPALIVVGTSDALTPTKYAEHMATHIPDSELHVIEGAGHMLVMERAGEIAGWIQSFVERIS